MEMEMGSQSQLSEPLKVVLDAAARAIVLGRNHIAQGRPHDYAAEVRANLDAAFAELRRQVERWSATKPKRLTIRPADDSLVVRAVDVRTDESLLCVVLCQQGRREGAVSELQGNDRLCEITVAPKANGLA